MLKIIKKLDKKDIYSILLSVVLIVLQIFLDLKMPDYMSEITKLVQTEGSLMSDILKNGILMLACALGSLILAVMTSYLISSMSSGFSKKIRKLLFTKVEDLSLAEIKKFETGSLITRTTNDITQVQMFFNMGLQLLIKSPLTAIWAITKIINKSWQFSILTGIAIIVILTVFSTILVMVVPKFKKVQKLTDKINSVTSENLKGIRVIRAFNAENYQEKKFEQVNNDLTNLQLFNQKKFAFLSPTMYLVMYTLALSIYFVGATIIENSLLIDKITIFGDMIVFSSYALQVIMSFLMLGLIFMLLPRANVSAKRINEVLDSEISIKNGGYNKKTKEKGTIIFKDVSFKYPDASEYTLENISFEIKQGETIAFIGSTGSGKSTLVDLILRFYDVTSGAIYVDGIDVREYNLECLYNKIGYVSQKAVMFNSTVKSNIIFGKSKNKKTNEDIIKALKISQGYEFVNKMSEKENTIISQGGTNISGGQKQRLSIARAIARNPEIYIFDDSFSALDYKTDSKLRHQLKTNMKDATSLIVAQRIGTIMNADKIIVLDNGKCVGCGKHDELLKNCEVYKQIALSQLSKEELENA